MSRRDAFALITVLWVMVAVSTTGLAGALAVRQRSGASVNRVEEERALWRANDCFSRARAQVDSLLVEARRHRSEARAWRTLDREPLRPGDGCAASLEAAGTRLDVNAASGAQLRAIFHALQIDDPDGLTAAVVEWRELYGMIDDLRQVPGLAATPIPTVLGVEPGRVALNSASPAVLAAIPGFTPEIVARIVRDRESGAPPIADVLALTSAVSRASADSISAHYLEIVRTTTPDPDAWILRARGWSGHPRATVLVEARLVLGQARATVVRLTAGIE